ncbi:hypothetical protein Plec18167_005698 [Paecilomyces lecythidis]|uniref:Uncharacterized protein n=1 Tax=Paecilomyces lecythidis TaxID=3004212 RepID=A0ABR3XGZ2_9EURO
MAPGIASTLPVEKTPNTSSTSLFHHSLITSDFDALKFHAAASLQLQSGQKYESAATKDHRLIASPYNEPAHLLDLNRLDTPNRLFAKALTIFKPIRHDYATAEYTESFNWDAVFQLLRALSDAEGYEWKKQEFYVVAFRSTLRADADPGYLHQLDAHSHAEATESGGLLKYWFGTKNENRKNLATCLWRNREDARLGGLGPWHKKARLAAREMYEQIVFTTLKLTIDDHVSSWKFNDWTDE